MTPGPVTTAIPRHVPWSLSARTVAIVAAVGLLLTVCAIVAMLWWVAASDLTGEALTAVRLDAIKIGLSIAVESGEVLVPYLAWRR